VTSGGPGGGFAGVGYIDVAHGAITGKEPNEINPNRMCCHNVNPVALYAKRTQSLSLLVLTIDLIKIQNELAAVAFADGFEAFFSYWQNH